MSQSAVATAANAATVPTPPSEFIDPKEKEKKGYGLKYAKHIWGQYMSSQAIWGDRKAQWILNRKYAEGLQSMDKYKNRLDVTDSSFMNLDYTPIPIIPKYVDNIVGKLSNQLYKIQCKVLDPSSRTAEDDAMKELKTKMYLKDLNEEVTSMTGIPFFAPGDYVPDSQEELDIYFQLNYKPSLAIAMELALDFVFENNNFSDIRNKVLRDFVNLKTAFIRKSYDKDYNIVVSHEDPVDVIVPYSKYDDYRNIPYAAVLKKITIGQLASSTTEFTEEQLFEIAKKYASRLQNPAWNLNWAWNSYDGYYNSDMWGGRPYDNFYINILEFEFLTLNTKKYEEKRNDLNSMYFAEKSFTYKPKENKKYNTSVTSKDIQERYEGCWVIDSDYLYSYKKSKNVPREKVSGNYNPQTCLSLRGISPGMYDMQNKSLTERMIPHADQMTLINLKLQQFVMKAIPPGIYFNIHAANEAIAAYGSAVKTPLDLIKMYQQTGSFGGTQLDDSGKVLNNDAIKVLPNGMGDISGFLAAYQSEMQKINDIIGYNSATDGSTPNVEALVGTQKLAVQSTNNTLRPLNDAFISLVKMVSKDVSLMIQDKFEYGGGLEGFERAIGSTAIDILEIGKRIPLCEYGIFIEFLPDEVERAEVEEFIRLALTTAPPQIDLADAIMVKQILKSNVKLASQTLVLRKKKYQEERIKESEAQSRMNAEQQAMSAQAAAQAKVEETTALIAIQKEMEAFKADQLIRVARETTAFELEKIAKQNEGKVAVADTQNDGKVMVEAMKPKPDVTASPTA